MRICASFGNGCDAAELEKADMIEIRTDLVGIPDDIPDRPLILTFKGNPVRLPNEFHGMVDIGETVFDHPGVESLCSYHDFSGTPGTDTILSILDSFTSDVVKGVFTPHDLNDLNSIRNAAVATERRHVVFGMGEVGKITRIRQDILGNEFTFAHSGNPTAAGQLSVSEMRKLEGCMVTGLIGHPLGHSLSPLMHNTAFAELGMNGIYLEFDTPNLIGLKEFMMNYDIRGTNVTIPYKMDVIEHLDVIDAEAEMIGAVNTVINDSGTLKGMNTDIHGIEHAFGDTDIHGKSVLVIGSGGAARACLYIMNKVGCTSTLASRNRETAGALAVEFGSESADPKDVDVNSHDIIVNCTPVGMKGFPEGPPVSLSGLSEKHIVFDMVYGTTALTRIAGELGATIISGKDMLAAQGARSFELWTGVEIDADIMRKVI